MHDLVTATVVFVALLVVSIWLNYSLWTSKQRYDRILLWLSVPMTTLLVLISGALVLTLLKQ